MRPDVLEELDAPIESALNVERAVVKGGA